MLINEVIHLSLPVSSCLCHVIMIALRDYMSTDFYL